MKMSGERLATCTSDYEQKGQRRHDFGGDQAILTYRPIDIGSYERNIYKRQSLIILHYNMIHFHLTKMEWDVDESTCFGLWTYSAATTHRLQYKSVTTHSVTALMQGCYDQYHWNYYWYYQSPLLCG